LPRWSLEEQSQGDAPLFSDEDVVGAAGGLRVHHLEPDARGTKGSRESRMRKALAAAGAEEHDLDAKARELGEVLGRQMREVAGIPIAHFGGGDDDVAFAPRAVHCDVIVAISGDGVRAARAGGMKFHATILAMREFSRIKRLPPYVFNITNELKMAARRHGEDIIDLSRSEEHTSELQSLAYLVCRLLLEKKKKNKDNKWSTNNNC